MIYASLNLKIYKQIFSSVTLAVVLSRDNLKDELSQIKKKNEKGLRLWQIAQVIVCIEKVVKTVKI